MLKHEITATSGAASQDGLGNDVTGASWALSATSPTDGLAHLITVKGNTATNHSAKTLTISGTNAEGYAISEQINLPNGTATVTTTKYFLTVTSPLVPSSTIGADTMDIGWALGSTTEAVYPKAKGGYWSMGFGCEISGSPTYTVQHSYNGTTYFDHSVVAGQTANKDGTYSGPVHSIRLKFTAAGTVTFVGIQTEA